MSTENIVINCKVGVTNEHYFGCRLVPHQSGFFKYLKENENYKTSQDEDFVTTNVDEKNIAIKQKFFGPDVHVCLIEITPDFRYIATENFQSRSWKSLRQTGLPIILYEDEYKRKIRCAEGKQSFAFDASGKEVKNSKEEFIRYLGEYNMNQTRGNRLAHEIGAIKYVQWNSGSGRGTKILIDEIAFAGLERLKEKTQGFVKVIN